MPDIVITQEDLKSIASFNTDTGEFTCIRTGRLLGSTYSDGYVYMYVKTKRYKAHRLVFLYITGNFPVYQVDHKNRIRNDNRWSNLRDVSHTENMRNKHTTILNDELVSTIRSRYISHSRVNGGRALAREYNLHRDTVDKILNNRLWKM